MLLRVRLWDLSWQTPACIISRNNWKQKNKMPRESTNATLMIRLAYRLMLKQLEENGRRTLSENGSNEEWMLSKHKGVQNTDAQWATVTLPHLRGWEI